MSPRPPPKISLKHEWKRELGSEVARQPEGDVRQAQSSQPTQPTPNPIRERSERPDNMQDGRNTYRSQEINVNSCCEELSSSERTGRPVEKMGKSVADHDESHESMMVNEADMDFRIPGLPHSVVKHAQSTSVRQLIQKIENHPDRHALQQDLRQNQSFNPFSPESKKNDSGGWEH